MKPYLIKEKLIIHKEVLVKINNKQTLFLIEKDKKSLIRN